MGGVRDIEDGGAGIEEEGGVGTGVEMRAGIYGFCTGVLAWGARRRRPDVGRWFKTAWMLGVCENGLRTGWSGVCVKVETQEGFVEVWKSGYGEAAASCSLGVRLCVHVR